MTLGPTMTLLVTPPAAYLEKDAGFGHKILLIERMRLLMRQEVAPNQEKRGP